MQRGLVRSCERLIITPLSFSEKQCLVRLLVFVLNREVLIKEVLEDSFDLSC